VRQPPCRINFLLFRLFQMSVDLPLFLIPVSGSECRSGGLVDADSRSDLRTQNMPQTQENKNTFGKKIRGTAERPSFAEKKEKK